jgi:superfamily II DNA/RNA helicase
MFRQAEVSELEEKAYRTTLDRLRQEHEQRMNEKRDAREALVAVLGEGEQHEQEWIESEDALALVELGIYRHAASLAKVESAIDIAKEAQEQGQGVLLFAAFRDTAERIATKLQADCLTGEVSRARRQEMIDRFQAGETKVLVATIGAGGIGINLTAAQVVIMVDRPWTPGDTEQAEDRAYRIGQHHNVTAIWLQYGPADERIDQLLQLKQERINQVLRGRRKDYRGVPSVRALAKEIMESIHSGKPLADILELDPAELEQKAVDLVRDPVPPASTQKPVQRQKPDRGQKKDKEGKDGRLKGEVPRIRKNVMFAEDVATFLESMKAPNQRTFVEGGYSGFLERLVRESPEYREYHSSQVQSEPE